LNLLGANISEYFLKHFGSEFLRRYEEYLQSKPKYFIRINRRENSEEILNSLKEYGIKLKRVEAIPFAYSIEEGIEVIGKTLEFILGKYYIQSLSSMIPPIALKATENDLTLDLCAAPGSKTTELSEMMNNKGTLIANEISVPRLRSLVHNLDKINAVNVGILNYKGELLSKVFNEYFDKILVDAPCSALGIIQKKEEVSRWWNTRQMEKIANLQLRLLIAAIKMAKVDGEIIYSTCTLTLEENELILQKVIEKYPVELVEINLPVFSRNAFTEFEGTSLKPELKKARRIFPWDLNSEGFFIAKLIKYGNTEGKKKEVIEKGGKELIEYNNIKISRYLNQISDWFGFEPEIFENFKFIIRNKEIFYVHRNWNSPSTAPFNRIGTKFGNIDSGGFAHLHTQSAQFIGRKAEENIFELKNYEQLKTYLDGGIIKGTRLQRGQKIIKFKNYILGTAIQTEKGLKSQFPRAHRTGKIILPGEKIA